MLSAEVIRKLKALKYEHAWIEDLQHLQKTSEVRMATLRLRHSSVPKAITARDTDRHNEVSRILQRAQTVYIYLSDDDES